MATRRVSCEHREPGGRCVLRRGLVLLLCILSVGAEIASEGRCREPGLNSKLVVLDHPKVTETGKNLGGEDTQHWVFEPPKQDVRVAVTPTEQNMDPDIGLYMRTKSSPSGASQCLLVANAQDYGGDMLLLSYKEMTQQLNATKYYLKVLCRKAGCEYHVAFTLGGEDTREYLELGRPKSGIAYRGTALLFAFNCTGECEKAALLGTNRRLTFSVWPRDATSVHHLRILVRHGQEPSSASSKHLQSSRGWYSGEVVGTPAQAGTFYITVTKKHGRMPMPFVIQVMLPETIQKIALGKPYFGAVGRNQVAFYTFEVVNPNTDIAVYLTKLDGDPDMSISHSSINPQPTDKTGQWHSRNVGDDEVVITPSDPKRSANPTGWFNVGVYGYKHTAFSIIVLAEPHAEKSDTSMIDWTELWLGLPQTFSASPGHPGNFLFYSQLFTPRLFVHLQTLEGERPDACMSSCGYDPHECPYISRFDNPDTVRRSPQVAVTTCEAAAIRSADQATQATVVKPCNGCWYALLVTSEASPNRTRFRVLLGAEGKAHPLVAGEVFQGHVDADDAAVLLVFDIPEGEYQNRSKLNSTLLFTMSTVYGDPSFTVHKGAEDGEVLFTSTTQEYFALPFDGKQKGTTFYIEVKATSKHARFRMQVAWDSASTVVLAGSAAQSEDGLKGIGLPLLVEGRTTEGVVKGAAPMIYLYEPLATGELKKPALRVTVRAEKSYGLRIYAVPVLSGKDHSHSNLASVLATTHASVVRDALAVGWVSKEGSAVLSIPSSDSRYVEPGSGHLYAVSVFRQTKDNTTVPFLVEVSVEGTILELPTTGTPLPGVVRAGEYCLYRVAVGESGRHLAIVLKAISGDADLFVGLNASVTQGSVVFASTLYGSDAIFVPAISQVNAEHCSPEVIQKHGECVYFVGVLGSSRFTEYEITATVPDGKPVKLEPNSDRMVFVPQRGQQYMLVPLEPPLRNMTLQVQVLNGKLASLNVKVMTLGHAYHPGPDETKLSSKTADFHGVKFAGVWSVQLSPEEMSVRCEKAGATATKGEGSCAAFVSLKAVQGFEGKVTLLVEGGYANAPSTENTTQQQKPQAPADGTPGGGLLMLEAGVPARGVLNSKEDIICYGFTVQDTKADLSVSVTPVTSCSPLLQLEFPTEGGSERQFETARPDTGLGFVSRRFPHDDARFRAGLFYLWVRQDETKRCEFDVRAQLEVTSSTADLADAGNAAPTTLLLNTPVYTSGIRSKYFVFTHLIDKAEDAFLREHLELRVSIIAGDLQVAVGVLNNSSPQGTKKGDLLATAFREIQEVPETSGGAPRSFACRLRERCGTALACQLFLRVRSLSAADAADYVVVAVDGSLGRSEVLVPRMPLSGCVGPQCPPGQGSASQYQMLVSNPLAAVKVRVSCLGPERVSLCNQLQLSADARAAMPQKLTERRFTRSQTGYGRIRLVANIQDAVGAGDCRVPCVLLIRLELKPDAATTVSSVNYTIMASSKSGYSLLIDGAEPVTARVKPGSAAYFLFDSRKESPLLTFTATIPFDPADKELEQISMYVLDCDEASPGNGTEGEQAMKALAEASGSKPSERNYRFQALPAPGGQLVTHISQSPGTGHKLDEGRHCYYRIAVVSHRENSVEFTIRGFDWHPGLPLILGEPLQGIVERTHPFSFQLKGSTDATTATSGQVSLSLEVCTGKALLSVSSMANGAEPRVTPYPPRSGPWPQLSKLEESRWLEVSVPEGDTASTFVLSAEDPARRSWLDNANSNLVLKQEGRSCTVAWPRARLLGAPPAHQDEVQYVLYYGRGDRYLSTWANLNAPCGLLREQRRNHLKQKVVGVDNTTVLTGLRAGRKYILNVVARHWSSGRTVAYTPYTHVAFPDLSSSRGEQEAHSGSLFWDDIGPVLIIGLSIAALIIARPCCRGRSMPTWRQFELELPSWSRARRPEIYTSGIGSYAPPSVVGQAQYSAMR